MTHRPILIVADARTERGKGHIMRCQAIAELLRKNGRAVELINDTDPLNTVSDVSGRLSKEALLILDGRDYDLAVEQAIKRSQCTLLRIIDLPLISTLSDAIISYSLWGPEAENALLGVPHRFLGFEYAVINEAFKNDSSNRTTRNAFICCGGLDEKNICGRIVMLLSQTNLIDSCTVVAPKANHAAIIQEASKSLPRIEVLSNLTTAELASTLCNATVAITSASTVALEACTVGVPVLVGVTVHDQRFLYEQLLRRGVAKGVGTFSSAHDFNTELSQLLTRDWQNIHTEQRRLFDGKGSERFLQAIEEVLG